MDLNFLNLLLNPNTAVFIVVGVAFLFIVMAVFYLKFANRQIPFMDKYTIKAFLLYKTEGGFLGEMDMVAIKMNPETENQEYFFKKKKKFYPPWRFSHILSNDWIIGFFENRDELYPCKVILTDAEVTDPYTGKKSIEHISKIRPMMDIQTLLKQHVLKQKNIREKWKGKE